METTAQEIMSTNVLKVTEGMSVEDTIKLLINSKITGLPVIDKKGQMIGIVSEYDILVQLRQKKNLKAEAFKEPVQFTRKIDSISEDATLDDIIERFISNKVRRLPVVDPKGKLVGIITRRDLMRVFYYRAQFS